VPLIAFLRLTTKVGLFPSPLPPAAAMGQITEWLGAAGAVLISPTPRHADVLAGLVASVGCDGLVLSGTTGTGGNLVNDAHLAALALEHRATIVSYDNDFARFDEVSRRTPDALLT